MLLLKKKKIENMMIDSRGKDIEKFEKYNAKKIIIFQVMKIYLYHILKIH